MTYSKAHVILDAVQFATHADTGNFGHLVVQNVHVLKRGLASRILLTYLPESIPPSHYTDLLHSLVTEAVFTAPSSQLPQPSKGLSEDEATTRLRILKLLPLVASTTVAENLDELDRFILSRARKIDAELGDVKLLQQLLQPFIGRSQVLKGWAVSTLLPLTRLDYEFYPHHGEKQSLVAFEKLHGRLGIERLLERGAASDNQTDGRYGRDLRSIVGPWMFGEACRRYQKLGIEGHRQLKIDDDIAELPQMNNVLVSCWGEINEWLLYLAKTHFQLALQYFEQWDGPRDVDFGGLLEGCFGGSTLGASERNYAQTGLAIIYQSQETTKAARDNAHATLAKAAKVSSLLLPPDSQSFDRDSFTSSITPDYLDTISTIHLLPAELLDTSNPLTKPSSDSLELAFLVLMSAQLMDNLGQTLAIESILRLTLFASQADQWDAFRRVLHSINAKSSLGDQGWVEAREQLLWLRAWQATSRPASARHGIFAQINTGDLETEILKTLLLNGRYKVVSQTYLDPQTPPVPTSQVEKSILEAVMASYDNASNGNRTRGGMKRANEIVTTFSSQFPSSDGFHRASALIAATHRLSFYSLTLQHGVPFLPVNIRVHLDPLSLLNKVLKQNAGSYTKLDDLLDIGRDFVRAGLIKPDQLEKTQNIDPEVLTVEEVERSITAKAVEASLAEDDFDTAYSYIVNRLATSRPQSFETTDTVATAGGGQEILWKAAYQAGRYHPKNRQGPSELRRLEQRMELLSQALLLAPPSSLQDVLTTWRGCEMELNAALAKETEEEKAWNDKGERTVPGGFSREDIAPRLQKSRETTRKALNEEAPMSLFDVTRNAATALSKSAFPLRGQRQGIAASESRLEANDQHQDSSETEASGRVRKRDMVSNMVTGSLASGIGWVIGKY